MAAIPQDIRLLEGLRDADPIVRKGALEELLLLPHLSSELLRELRPMAAREQHEECLLLLNLLFDINKIARSAPAEQAAAEQPKERTFRDFLESYLAQPAQKRLAWLKALHAKHPQQGAQFAAQLFMSEPQTTLKAYMLHLFHAHWPEEALDVLVQALSADTFSIRLAALTSLVKRAPQRFLTELPRFLRSPDARFRALAVRGLSQIDPETSCAYLEQMIMEGTADERRLALASALIMPFEEVREVRSASSPIRSCST